MPRAKLIKPSKQVKEGGKSILLRHREAIEGGKKALSVSKNKKALNELKASRSEKFILLIGEEGAVLIHLRKGHVLARLYSPSAEAKETEAFTEKVSHHPGVPLMLVFDTIDQIYVQQTLPPVSSLSINKLIKRRLDRDFSNNHIKGAIKLGHEKTGRKDWVFMLVAIQRNTLFKNWMKIVLEWPTRCNGIQLLPVECAEVFQRMQKSLGDEDASPAGGVMEEAAKTSPDLEQKTSAASASGLNDAFKDSAAGSADEDDKPAVTEIKPATTGQHKWHFLVVHNKVSGIRQVVYKNGKLLLTRLSQPAVDATSGTIAGMIEQEVAGTKEYLKRLGYKGRESLSLIIIVSEEVRGNIDIPKSIANHVHILSPLEAAQLLGLADAAKETDRYADTVLSAGILSNKKVQLKLATPSLNRQMRLVQAGYALTAAAVMLIGYFAFQLYTDVSSVFSVQREIEENEQQKNALQGQVEALKKQAQWPVEEMDRVGSIIDVYLGIKGFEEGPDNLLETISTILANSVRSDSIKWNFELRKNPQNAVGPAIPTETVSMTLSFIMGEGGRDRMRQDTTDVINALKIKLPDYSIYYEKLPEVINEERSINLNVGDPAEEDKEALGKVYDAAIIISGEVKAEKEGDNGTP